MTDSTQQYRNTIKDSIGTLEINQDAHTARQQASATLKSRKWTAPMTLVLNDN